MSQEASFNKIKKEEEDTLDTFNNANDCDNNDVDTIQNNYIEIVPKSEG